MGCDVNQATKDGETPAFLAAQEGHTAALKHLVKAGCDVNQAAKDGRTPADIAAQNGLTAALAAAATLEKNNSKRKEKNKKNNSKKKEKRMMARAAIEGETVEEEVLLVSEELSPQLAPSSGPGDERPEADSNNLTLRVGGVGAVSDDSDWEVELCQCFRCLEVDNAAA